MKAISICSLHIISKYIYIFILLISWLQNGFSTPNLISRVQSFPDGSAVKNSPAVRGTQVQYLVWEDPLEEEMATRSSINAWKSPWIEEPSRLPSTGSQRVGRDWAHVHIFLMKSFSLREYLSRYNENIFWCYTKNKVVFCFLMWVIFKVFVKSITILFLLFLCFGLLAPRHVGS